jgi:(E)-4-hydroxy-3-methylbut-2-enyl-diphosphate synthase
MWEAEGRKPVKVAIMGCEVNGPGEASQADIGIAFGKVRGALFKKGKILGSYPADECLDILFRLIEDELK